jgi:hypothetical protein
LSYESFVLLSLLEKKKKWFIRTNWFKKTRIHSQSSMLQIQKRK